MNLETFQERLDEVFGGRYRIRWSDARHEYHIEQKVRRGIAEGFADMNPRHMQRAREKWDDRIRARDGYHLTMVVSPGTTASCPSCHSDLKMPAFDTAVVTCEFCRSKGRYSQKVGGYYPLGETLIDHLRFIDVDNDGNDRVTDAVDRHNAAYLHDNKMALRRPIEAATRERFNRLVGIPHFGYAGRPYRWVR